MKKIFSFFLITISFVYANPYAKCVACHGANGGNVALGQSKVIKNMTKEEIIFSLQGYKDGTYGGSMKAIMKPQVSSLSSEDIKFIAEMIGK